MIIGNARNFKRVLIIPESFIGDLKCIHDFDTIITRSTVNYSLNFNIRFHFL